VPGPRNLQTLTVEYTVTGELDGTTPAPPIDLNPGGTPFDEDSQIYQGGEVENLGLIDPDLVTQGGAIGSRNITSIWIDTEELGAPNAGIDVVGVRADGSIALQKEIVDLAGAAGGFVDDGFLVQQGSDVRVDGFVAQLGEPIRVRMSIAVPKSVSDYAWQMASEVPPPCGPTGPTGVTGPTGATGATGPTGPTTPIPTLQQVTNAGATTTKDLTTGTLTPDDPADDIGTALSPWHQGRFSGLVAAAGSVGFGDSEMSGSGWEWTTNGTTSAWLYYNGTRKYFMTAGSSGFYSDTHKVMWCGATTRYWAGIVSQGALWDVNDIGDASATLDNEMLNSITEPAAGANVATLPAAILGRMYFLEVVAGAGGQVNLATTGGDTVNGGAAPANIGAGMHLIYAKNANNWTWYKIA